MFSEASVSHSVQEEGGLPTGGLPPWGGGLPTEGFAYGGILYPGGLPMGGGVCVQGG